MRIAIAGAGIMGIALGYQLARQGIHVDIYEASSSLGGLAGPLTLPDGTVVDRFYHAILSSDSTLAGLCQELGIADRMRFRQTRMGFYHQGAIHPMNDVRDFMRFPPLGWIDRFRLGLTVLAAQMTRDWRKLETMSVKAWLVRWSGANGYENLWRPMLKAKFDGGFDNVPATWIWSRLVRTKSTRNGANQKEEAGHLIGGYITLLEAMAAKIRETGGEIHLSTAIQEIVIENNRVTGIRLKDEVTPYDAVVATMQTPVLSRLIPDADPAYREALAAQEYLGIVCPIVALDKPLTGYWTLNITDDTVPFTGVIETTAFIDPQYVGGYHLVYLPKYTAPGSPWQQRTDEEIRAIWLENLQAMFPQFDLGSIRHFVVNRTRYVEPLHGLGETDRIPAVKSPVAGLYLATTSQIYPDLTNGESVCRYAAQSAAIVVEDMAGMAPAAAPAEGLGSAATVAAAE